MRESSSVEELQFLAKLQKEVRLAFENENLDDVLAAIRTKRGEGGAVSEAPLRSAEYERFLSAPDETPGLLAPEGEKFAAFRIPEPRADLPTGVSRLVLVPELREVRVQVSFSRFDLVSARRRVVLAGYSFKNAENVLEPLEQVMVEHGVETHFFIDVKQPEHQPENEEAYGQEQLVKFLEANWPFATPPPALYCDRRALRPGYGGDFCSLHAKCVAVDSRRAFISSANFTLRAQDRNIETGVLIDEPHFAQQLDRQWMSLGQGALVLRG